MFRLLCFLVFTGASFYGRVGHSASSQMMSPFPAARFYPDSVGILYPSISVAGGVNPAALPVMGKGTYISAAYTPTAQKATDPQSIFGSVATANKSLGVGIGYQANAFSGGSTFHSVFAGAGYALDNVSFGIGVRDPDVRGDISPDVDLGFIYGGSKSQFSVGVVGYHINRNGRLAIGFGAGGPKKYNLEMNLMLPPFNSGSGQYVLTASASLFPGMFGISFRSSYFSDFKDFDHTAAVALNFLGNFTVVAQYSTQRRYTGALTVNF